MLNFKKLLILLKILILAINLCFASNSKNSWLEMYEEVISLQNKGLYNKGLEVANKIIPLSKITYGESSIQYAKSIDIYAILKTTLSQYDGVKELHEKALSIKIDVMGRDNMEVAATCNNLAAFLHSQGKYFEAEKHLILSLEIINKIGGYTHEKFPMFINNLAVNYLEQNKFQKSESLLIDAINTAKKSSVEHVNLGYLYNNIGSLYMLTNQDSLARKNFQITLSIFKNHLRNDHPDLGIAMGNLGTLLSRTNQIDEALTLLKESLSILKKEYGKNQVNVIQAMNGIGGIYTSKGMYEKAEKLLLEAQEIENLIFTPNHPERINTLDNLLTLYYKQENYDLSERYSKESISLIEKNFGSNSQYIQRPLTYLILIAEKTNRNELAKSYRSRLKSLKALVQ